MLWSHVLTFFIGIASGLATNFIIWGFKKVIKILKNNKEQLTTVIFVLGLLLCVMSFIFFMINFIRFIALRFEFSDNSYVFYLTLVLLCTIATHIVLKKLFRQR